MTQGQKCKATEEQLAALDAELAAHGIRPEDPRHPLAGRPQNALEDAMITGLGLEGSADRAGFLATFCKVEKRTARTWLRDSREMSRNAVAIVLDVLARDMRGPNGAPLGRRGTFEYVFLGFLGANRRYVLLTEAMYMVTRLDNKRLDALLELFDAFGIEGARFIEQADPRLNTTLISYGVLQIADAAGRLAEHFNVR